MTKELRKIKKGSHLMLRLVSGTNMQQSYLNISHICKVMIQKKRPTN